MWRVERRRAINEYRPMIAEHSEKPVSEQRFLTSEKTCTHWVFGGDVSVVHGPMQLTTILGSCIAACVSDPFAGVAGMNHFMLPEQHVASDRNNERAALYGRDAMDQLLQALYAAGAHRSRLSIKLFGGAWPGHKRRGFPVGPANVQFVRDYLAVLALPIHFSDLGGEHSRRIHFMTGEDRVTCQHLDHPDERRMPAAGEQDVARSAFDGAAVL